MVHVNKLYNQPTFTGIKARATKAKEAWDILKVEYHGDDKVRAINLQTLRRDFENMKMKEKETFA
ncbi:hypothetical protein RJ640_002078 [Escallonia rubra]|uniref:Uncharacterized protein n=1 Tax=Escallonia rubra TaxID=112253 RepID=A0AA88UF57_9ASTE|nr:hypothetical protein RJ640_002078 [Escallonia rubra]